MTARIFIGAAEVAHLMGIASASAFLARRSDLEARLGFPSPAPWQRRPLLWRRDSVQAWVDGLGAIPSAALALELRQPIAAMIAATPDRDRLLHYEGTAGRSASQPYSGDLFRKTWARVRAEAAKAVPSCATLQFRDLRRTFASLARAGGADRRRRRGRCRTASANG